MSPPFFQPIINPLNAELNPICHLLVLESSEYGVSGVYISHVYLVLNYVLFYH